MTNENHNSIFVAIVMYYLHGQKSMPNQLHGIDRFQLIGIWRPTVQCYL